MSDFSQIAFVLGLKEGIIPSWDKRVYLTLLFAHHNAPQHFGSNDLHLYSLLNTYEASTESILTQVVECTTAAFNCTAHQCTLSKLQNEQLIACDRPE